MFEFILNHFWQLNWSLCPKSPLPWDQSVCDTRIKSCLYLVPILSRPSLFMLFDMLFWANNCIYSYWCLCWWLNHMGKCLLHSLFETLGIKETVNTCCIHFLIFWESKGCLMTQGNILITSVLWLVAGPGSWASEWTGVLKRFQSEFGNSR